MMFICMQSSLARFLTSPNRRHLLLILEATCEALVNSRPKWPKQVLLGNNDGVQGK